MHPVVTLKMWIFNHHVILHPYTLTMDVVMISKACVRTSSAQDSLTTITFITQSLKLKSKAGNSNHRPSYLTTTMTHNIPLFRCKQRPKFSRQDMPIPIRNQHLFCS